MISTPWVVVIRIMRWNSLPSIYETAKPPLTLSFSTTPVIPITAPTRWIRKLGGIRFREFNLYPKASAKCSKSLSTRDETGPPVSHGDSGEPQSSAVCSNHQPTLEKWYPERDRERGREESIPHPMLLVTIAPPWWSPPRFRPTQPAARWQALRQNQIFPTILGEVGTGRWVLMGSRT